jgi:hypothetical protein
MEYAFIYLFIYQFTHTTLSLSLSTLICNTKEEAAKQAADYASEPEKLAKKRYVT